jgi:ribokinase
LPSRRRVVVVGAHAQSMWLRVEQVPKEGETVLGWGFEEPLDGGKATNQAVAAAKLGVPVSFVSAFGDDERGERIRHYLLDEGVDLSYAVVVHGPTDVGFNILPKSGVPAIVTASDKTCLIDKATVELAAPVLREASCVLCQLEAPPEVASAAFGIAHANGTLTVLNPAPAADLDDDLVALTDVLVPNEHEAAALVGHNAPFADLAAELQRELGIGTVILTAGADGAFLASGDGSVNHVPAPRVQAVDTTGAGDAFIGALASRLHEGRPLLEAVHFGVLYAARSVTLAGTLPAYARREEVEDDFLAVERAGYVERADGR